MSRLAALVAIVLIAAACSPGEPSITTTTSLPPDTTGAPQTSTAPSGTEGPTTSTTAVETTASTTTTTMPPTELVLRLEEVPGTFGQPLFLVSPPGDQRLFILDQPGIVWVLDGGEQHPFLDIRDDVGFGGERGLLGMAFPTDYADTGLFYLNFTDVGGDTRVVEYRVSEDPNRADPASRRDVLTIAQPAGNHNGGMIAFGPDDMLWIGMGDGGAAGDTFGHGQRPDTLLASMLRIEVGPAAPQPYGIPADNPYADGTGGAPEVWAYGLRNPWRFSFDGDEIWVADVGQGAIEEVDRANVRDGGLNYGWSVMEGSDCFRSSSCDSAGLVLPVYEYGHDEGCSVTGGYVYRGAAIPELAGHYFLADFCNGFIRSIDPTGAVVDWTDDLGRQSRVSSFGLDAAGELYVVTFPGIFKLVRG